MQRCHSENKIYIIVRAEPHLSDLARGTHTTVAPGTRVKTTRGTRAIHARFPF
jgi:hypothetical protein